MVREKGGQSMFPEKIPNYINGEMKFSSSGLFFGNLNPADSQVICQVTRSCSDDVMEAIEYACASQEEWAAQTVVSRGELVRDIAMRMQERKEEIAGIVANESGKSFTQALGETGAAIEMGFFMAGEGRRYYGRTTTSSTKGRQVFTVRQPVGIASLIIASNTPIANVAWKAFPSILCGNASLLKPSEDTPGTAWIFADICREVGLPAGILNVIQGIGNEVGPAMVESDLIDLVSFTGGTETGKFIQETAGRRLAKVCLELGGKNALVVCDDADMELAVDWAMQSAFSNAGQRCAAASRIIIQSSVYDAFKQRLLERVADITLGVSDTDFLGPVINATALEKMCSAVQSAVEKGATVLCGGGRLLGDTHRKGFYMDPTILENIAPEDEISRLELFGPIANLYKVASLPEAVELANNSPFGLTASIHTTNIHRAMAFAEKVKTGVVVVNGGTHGSEPHMGFGGPKASGTGWREAGVEALDVYSEWKYINLITDSRKV